jgi:hypothetical protein
MRRWLSVAYLARGITMTRFHIILGWLLLRFLSLCKVAEALRKWNMLRWRDGMLFDLKKYAKYRGENGKGNDTDTD